MALRNRELHATNDDVVMKIECPKLCIKMCPYVFLCSHVVVSDNAHADKALQLTARFA